MSFGEIHIHAEDAKSIHVQLTAASFRDVSGLLGREWIGVRTEGVGP